MPDGQFYKGWGEILVCQLIQTDGEASQKRHARLSCPIDLTFGNENAEYYDQSMADIACSPQNAGDLKSRDQENRHKKIETKIESLYHSESLHELFKFLYCHV